MGNKNIIFCADGTWQTPRNGTNVYRIYKGLLTSATQLPFYDDGVGADGTGFEKLIEGAIGEGLIGKIKDGYKKIAHSFDPGDRIFLFGFSRGAYTVRSLAGMIAACGMPTGGFTDDQVDRLFDAYRTPANRETLKSHTGLALENCGIEMIGVWDTVGSLGIPAIFGGFDEKDFGFLDVTLHATVKAAYHCVSIDERRRQFPATLWSGTLAAGQILEQVYFCGCHGDIGGGTEFGGGVDQATRLCDFSLNYMVTKSQQHGLEFDSAFLSQASAPSDDGAMDHYSDSWKIEFQQPQSRPIAPDACVANSVAVRVDYILNYRPENLVIEDDGTLAATYNVIPVMSS